MTIETRIDALASGGRIRNTYRIEKILGAGSFGITYLVQHEMLSTWHVIKEYMPAETAVREHGSSTVRIRSSRDQALFEWGLNSFYDEARLLHQIRHPNIIRVTDLWKENDTAYFVMPYLEGITLDEWIARNRQPTQDQLEVIFVPLLEGLKYIHARNLLHRDIKPENVFIMQNTNPILIDFGAAGTVSVQRGRAASYSHGLAAKNQ